MVGKQGEQQNKDIVIGLHLSKDKFPFLLAFSTLRFILKELTWVDKTKISSSKIQHNAKTGLVKQPLDLCHTTILSAIF